MIELRDYQRGMVGSSRAAFARVRRVLLVLPTGGGKTFTFSWIAQSAVARGGRVLVLVHRQELLMQASRSLDSLGVPHGLIAARFSMNLLQPVQVASVQTLVRRMDALHWEPDLIIVDEAHHAVAGSWRKVLDRYSSARVLGVTATPCRADGRGLGDVFDELVIGPSVRWLMSEGHLTPARVYAPPQVVDLSGVRRQGGDYQRGELGLRMDNRTITGDAVEHYRRICGGLPAIAFCVSVAHAEHVAEQFRAAGFRSESLDGSMDDALRRERIASLADGRLQVLTSCDIVSEGTDIPVVSAAILLRPTMSTGLYLQQVGRVLRPAPGKEHAIVLDHVGNVLRHGLPEEDRDWTLEGTSARRGQQVPAVRQCPKCFTAHSPRPACPTCGHVYQSDPTERVPVTAGGELIELDAARRQLLEQERKRARYREQAQAQTLEQLIELGRQRGYKNPVAWAEHVHRSRQNSNGAFRAARG
jgi:superfamily II DNA or RNA helicase